MNNSIDPVRIISGIECMLVYIIRNTRADVLSDLFILPVSTHEQAFIAKNTLNMWMNTIKILHL